MEPEDDEALMRVDPRSNTVTATVPVRVDYELTALGVSLTPVLHALKTWSEGHIAQILDARDAYDARDGEPVMATPARV